MLEGFMVYQKIFLNLAMPNYTALASQSKYIKLVLMWHQFVLLNEAFR